MELQFTTVFRKVPEGYIGFVEERPGANTQGATLEQARANLQEAVEMVQPLVRRQVECYAGLMTIKARVRAGRLVVDEPTTLPEGTELELLPLDPGDWLDDTDRAALHAALAQSQTDVAAGRLIDAADLIKALRAR